MKYLSRLIISRRIRQNYIKYFLPSCRCLHIRPTLICRDFISPEDYTSEELKSLLWTAIDFKQSRKRCIEVLSKRKQNVTILIGQADVIAQVAIANAVHKMGFDVNVVHQACLDSSPSDSDLGRALTQLTDIIVGVNLKHPTLKLLADGASVPVVNYSSSMYRPIPSLANIMAVFEYFCFLQNLTLGWIGPWNTSLDSYLILGPKFGMNVQFATTAEKEGRKVAKQAFQCAVENGAGVHQKIDACEAVYRAHVLATSAHSCDNMTITKKMVDEAATNWVLVPELPRSRVEVTDDVYGSTNNLVWTSCENLMWVSTAVFFNLLQDHCPRIPRPDFEGCNIPVEKYYQK